ncbi:MAG: crossover junction endodeoxyribonuclease RuvC [Ignavibacteriales bacterium CG_4_9_14_3_um_filter_34_10]|nr:MAG: crossover junction endodeoxyribonuclease RuvC [Ignavibacteriales bacterium CG_4_9_14_3_um_filter_34_10]
MIVLGIDPGTLFTGFGIVRYKNFEFIKIHSGVIKLPPGEDIPLRLDIIYSEINKLCKKFKPNQFAIETAFYGKNVQSAMKIGYARGVSVLAAYHNNLEIGEYSPREVKKAVVGNGAASKEQVQYMVKKLLGLDEKKIKFDETDALAVAICHSFGMNSVLKSKGKNWKDFLEKNKHLIING